MVLMGMMLKRRYRIRSRGSEAGDQKQGIRSYQKCCGCETGECESMGA